MSFVTKRMQASPARGKESPMYVALSRRPAGSPLYVFWSLEDIVSK